MKKVIMVMAVGTTLLLAGLQTTSETKESPNPVKETVKRLELGKPLSHGNLTIIPVYMNKISDHTLYPTLEEAAKKGWVTITEVEGGRVPQVKISNTSKDIVYLMGGEILTGCRQDRILAGDILLAPGTRDLLVPVYCVEHGRWTQTSSQFYSKQNIGTPQMRAKAQEKTSGAQSEIWGYIADQNQKMGVASPTNAYQDAYENKENRTQILKIEEKMKDIPRLQKDTVGVVIGLGGKVASVDIFVNSDLFAKQWPKILKSSALYSIGNTTRGTLGRDKAAEFLKAFMDKSYRRQDGLDLGFDYTSSDSEVNIQALAYNENVIHLAGFPQEKDRVKVLDDNNPNQSIRFLRDNDNVQQLSPMQRRDDN